MSQNYSILSYKSFRQLYDTQLLPILTTLESERKKIANQSFATIFFGLVAVAAWLLREISKKSSISLANSFGGPEFLLVIFCVAIIIGLIIGFIAHTNYASYRVRFKSQIVEKLIETFFPGFDYQAHNGISMDTYWRSEIYKTGVDRYNSEDYASGTNGITKIEFSEVHSEYKTETTDSKGRRRTQWHTIFRGLFFKADFNKKIKGRTFVLPDSAESALGSVIGGWLQKANASFASRGEKVTLENPIFEKSFVVYSDDQTEARYILTPKMMDDILDIAKTMKCVPALSFIQDHVYVAIACQDLFEPKIFSTGIDPVALWEVIEIFQKVIGIVEELDLNTRIWTKS